MVEKRTSAYWVRIQQESIDIAAAEDFLRTEEAGAVDIFLGTTRRWTDGRETDRLEYECYHAMAIAEMQRLVRAAADRWHVEKACVIHREGLVPLREVSVLIGVATPHRADAFEACRYLIDELKTSVPIWKRERFSDGSTAWVEGSEPRSMTEEETK